MKNRDLQNIVIVGATSAIAQAVARAYAAEQANLLLVGRSESRLDSVANDLSTRGASSVSTEVCEIMEESAQDRVVAKVSERFQRIDVVLVAYGLLVDQATTEQSAAELIEAFAVNATSVMNLCHKFSESLLKQQSGVLAVISSVAGDRGRASNYVYGSAKAAVSVFLSGLRNRLAGDGVHVLTVKPGLIDTPMTAGFSKGPLWSTPDIVAYDIRRAIKRRRNVIYTPWFWRFIMIIIRVIPERLFKRLSL